MRSKILALMAFAILVYSCATLRLEKRLDPESKEFYSKVRYCITPQEKKASLNLSPSERKLFIEDFWNKRDPDPETPVNEFKEQYFHRIEEANHLFTEGGTRGWLQDRGRIWITLGPPDHRETYPRGQSLYGKPVEIWHYGFFPIVFIDQAWNGNYELEPLSAQQLAIINQTQMNWKPNPGNKTEGAGFEFDLNPMRTDEGKVLFQISIPYKEIWLVAKEGKFETVLEVKLEVENEAKKKVWDFEKLYNLAIDQKDMKDYLGKNYLIEAEAELTPGDYTIAIRIENKTEQKASHKKAKFIL
jgi:GWxTD domain-containing protein